ncbi:MAG TPA: hypothetical protein VGE11_18755, partial [Pseudonocardia sp.]
MVDAHPSARPGIVLARRDLPPEDVGWVRDLRVASPAFAALETATVLPQGSAFLDRCCNGTCRSPTSTAATAETWADGVPAGQAP